MFNLIISTPGIVIMLRTSIAQFMMHVILSLRTFASVTASQPLRKRKSVSFVTFRLGAATSLIKPAHKGNGTRREWIRDIYVTISFNGLYLHIHNYVGYVHCMYVYIYLYPRLADSHRQMRISFGVIANHFGQLIRSILG